MITSHSLSRLVRRSSSLMGAAAAVGLLVGCADAPGPTAPPAARLLEDGAMSPDGAGPVFVVTGFADAVDAAPGDGVCATAPDPDGGTTCTLRAAIQEANALAGAQTVMLPPGTYPLTIPSATQTSGAESGGLDVTDALTIRGAGAGSTAIDCAGPGYPTAPLEAPCGIYGGPLFAIHAAPVVITDVTLTRTNPTLGYIVSAPLMQVDPDANLTLRDATVKQHVHIAIRNEGTLVLDRVTVSDNASASAGTGLSNGGTATINASTFSRNTAQFGGAAIANGGELTITNSTLSDNATIGDVLERGGALSNSGTATLNGVTIAGNHVGTVPQRCCLAAGVSSLPGRAGFPGVLRMSNTVVAGNTTSYFGVPTPEDCEGTITSLGYNMIQSPGGCTIEEGDKGKGDLFGVDPLLGPLAENGGPTQTRALLAGSPAIGAGSPARGRGVPNACTSIDQRGLPRRGLCDIGAFEVQR